MKIGFLGDSITEGVGASDVSKNYVSQVGKISGAEVKNYGISATRIARNKSLSYGHGGDMDFNFRFCFLDKSLDYIFVFGGTNDFGHGDAKFGTATERNVYTFGGALNTLVDKLIKTYGKDKVVFITPLKRVDEDHPNPNSGKYLSEYVALMKKILERRGIRYLDFYEELLPRPDTAELSEFFVDGLHPNDKGHRIITERICEFLKAEKN